MNILVIASRVPFPLEKGDKLRLYHQLKHLSSKHTLTLCALQDHALTDAQLEALGPLAQHIHVLRTPLLRKLWRMMWAWTSELPFQVTWFTDRKAKRQLERIVADTQPDLIYCQLVRCAEYVKDLHAYPKVLDYMDAFSAGMHRRSHQERGLLGLFRHAVMRAEGTRLARHESRTFDYFDAHTIISENDRLLIPHLHRDTIRIVPNGVDLEAFSGAEGTAPDVPTLLFTGNMSYAPNVDAAQHLVQNILPHIQTRPIRVVLAGAEPAPSVAALASDEVTVTGWVDDIAAEYTRATLFVAPLRLGTGLQNKVLEAMASALPCVLSPHAFAPLGMPAHGHAEICDQPEEFAAGIDRLLAHPEEAQGMAQMAQGAVSRKFAWTTHGETLDQVLQDALSPH